MSESPNSLSPSPHVNYGSTLGALYIGVALSSILYGITCLQTFFYFQSQNRDRLAVKSLVIILLLLDTTHQCFILHSGYYYTILNFNNPAALSTSVWSLSTGVLLISTTAFFTECFYAWRLYLLSNGNKLLLILILLLTCVHFSTGFAWTVRALLNATSSELSALFPIAGTSLAAAVSLDSIIFICLVYYLRLNRTGFSRSDTIINQIIKYAVATGLVTIIDSTLTLGFYAALPDDLYFITFAAMSPKLYTNSLLATLNTRGTLREIAGRHAQSFSLPTLRHGQTASINGSDNARIEIRVDTSQNRVSEMDALGKARIYHEDLAEATSNDIKSEDFGTTPKEQV